MMNKFFMGVCFSLLPISQLQASAVDVEFQHETISFPEPPRVSLLLQVLNNQTKVDWPTAKLYRTDSPRQPQLLEDQRAILADLKALIIFWHQEQQISQQLSALRREIASWQLGVFVNTPLDLDLTMIRQDFNPVLSPGVYLLRATKRPNYVSIVALGGRNDVVYQQGKPAYQYLGEANFADNVKAVDTVFYYPNHAYENLTGVKTIPVAAWNKTAEPLANGTLLFVPISTDVLTEQYASLNDQIAELAQYRIAP